MALALQHCRLGSTHCLNDTKSFLLSTCRQMRFQVNLFHPIFSVSSPRVSGLISSHPDRLSFHLRLSCFGSVRWVSYYITHFTLRYGQRSVATYFHHHPSHHIYFLPSGASTQTLLCPVLGQKGAMPHLTLLLLMLMFMEDWASRQSRQEGPHGVVC